MKVYRNDKARLNILRSYDKLLSMWNVDTEEHDIPTSFGMTHVISCGNRLNPPIVLFHGVGDDSALMWIYNAAALAKHYRVYAIDTIGGPGKSVPNENYNKYFCDDKWIDEVLSGLMLKRVFMAGVSHGAYLTQFYGLHRPEKVIRMMCLAGTVPAGESSPMKIFLPEALFPTKNNTVKLIKKLCGEHSEVFTAKPEIMEHYQALLKGFNNMAMRFHRVDCFSDEQINEIRGKTLYFIGESDPFALLGGKDMLLRYKMNAQFFPGVGHGINHEAANEINKAFAEMAVQNDNI